MNLLTIFAIELSLLPLTLLFWSIYEVSLKKQTPFNLPKLALSELKFPTFPTNSFLGRLQQDFIHIYKAIHPEFFVSPDGNTLYLEFKYTSNWKPEQVVLMMLAHKQEFLDQLKASDPTVFEAVNSLIDKVDIAKIQVTFKNMNILPSFTKDMVVWKLPLSASIQPVADVIVKELTTK